MNDLLCFSGSLYNHATALMPVCLTVYLLIPQKYPSIYSSVYTMLLYAVYDAASLYNPGMSPSIDLFRSQGKRHGRGSLGGHVKRVNHRDVFDA